MKKNIIIVTALILVAIILIVSVIAISVKKYINQNYLFITEGQNEIIENIFLECTSRYMISLRSEKEQYFIPEYIEQIGWNDNYIVVLQYDLVLQNSYNGYTIPNRDKKNYYIIDLRKKSVKGPISEDEYKKANLNHIKLKKVI